MKASELGYGLAHELAVTAAKAGWELSDFTALAQNESLCREALAVIRKDSLPEIVGNAEPPQPRLRVQILRETPKPCANRATDEQVAGMKAMYEALGWEFRESGLVVPARRNGFDRLIVVGNTKLTNNGVFDACAASFPCRRYADDLDAAVPSDKDERHPKNGVYAVWFRDRAEADEELKNLSANDIAGQGLKTNTLLERELFELAHFRETGGHPDVGNITLCSGSRCAGSRVPDVDWCVDEFGVGWCCAGRRSGGLRSRAVSL